MSTWERIESMARSVALTGGLEARIADPLWMLARQSQFSEFKGDDAAQPAAVSVTRRSMRLTGLGGIAGKRRAMPESSPLEAIVEAAPAPDSGAAGVFSSARASRRLIRLLTQAGLAAAIGTLRAAFPLAVPDRSVSFGNAGSQAVSLLSRQGLDGAALANANATAIRRALGTKLSAADRTRVQTIIGEWKSWYTLREGSGGDFAWNDERLEYSFRLSVGGASARDPIPVELNAPEHDGTHLDWYAFDVARNAAKSAAIVVPPVTALPAPVRYQGMPASRWWQFEDGTVNLGDLDAGPADLARLLLAEFALVYSDDWFVVPVSVPVGTITEITNLEVIDTFGGRQKILSTALNDATRTSVPRVWRLFELTGDEVGPKHPSPWLLVAPTLANDVNGPALERVILARDEGANLAWAIERVVEGPLGRGVDRAEAWHAALGASRPPPVASPSADVVAAATSAEQSWTYRLEASSPPWWIPFLPERVAPDSEQVRLRRARMQAWELVTEAGAKSQVGPQSVLFDPRRPRWIYEEEVPRSGVRVERRWQFGRWSDGSFHVWLQRRKLAGSGERSSGVRWDLLQTTL